jgi:hypothetical protein
MFAANARSNRHTSKGWTLILLTIISFGVAGTACFEDEFDPAGRAEFVIIDQIGAELGVDAEVTCVEPTSIEVGTEFECSAAAADGNTYHFIVTVEPEEQVSTVLDVRYEG